MGKIIIKDAAFSCNIGVSEDERCKKQKIILDIELLLNTKKASQTDKILDTVNYSEICLKIKKMLGKKSFKLIEALAEDIASDILKNKKIKKLKLTVKKPMALKKYNASYAAFEIERK